MWRSFQYEPRRVDEWCNAACHACWWMLWHSLSGSNYWWMKWRSLSREWMTTNGMTWFLRELLSNELSKEYDEACHANGSKWTNGVTQLVTRVGEVCDADCHAIAADEWSDAVFHVNDWRWMAWFSHKLSMNMTKPAIPMDHVKQLVKRYLFMPKHNATHLSSRTPDPYILQVTWLAR